MASRLYRPVEGLRASYARLTEEQKTMGLALAGIGVASVDYRRDEIVLDAVAAAIFGLPPDTPLPRPDFHARIHPDDWPQVASEVNRLLDPGFDDIIDVVHRTIGADGATRWVHARKRLYRDPACRDRSALTGTAAIRDITAEVEAREKNELLLRELDHRTRNLVTVASAIAQQTMQSSGPENFLDRFLPRLGNLADNRDIVAPTGHADLRETVTAAMAKFVGTGEGTWTLDGPPVRLDATASQTLSMVAHELTTNAVKYGALSRLGGQVRVGWSVEPDGGFLFRWEESGGPPVLEPRQEGFGSRILTRYVAMTLSATSSLAYEETGFRYQLRVPGRG